MTFGYTVKGCRAYLALRGSVDVPPVMDSRSTYVRAKIGDFERRGLRAGDRLAAGTEFVREGCAVTVSESYSTIPYDIPRSVNRLMCPEISRMSHVLKDRIIKILIMKD